MLLCIEDAEGLTSEEDGTVMVRDDLDALLQVCWNLTYPSLFISMQHFQCCRWLHCLDFVEQSSILSVIRFRPGGVWGQPNGLGISGLAVRKATFLKTHPSYDGRRSITANKC